MLRAKVIGAKGLSPVGIRARASRHSLKVRARNCSSSGGFWGKQFRIGGEERLNRVDGRDVVASARSERWGIMRNEIVEKEDGDPELMQRDERLIR